MGKYGLKASQVVEMARRYKNYQEKRKLGTREQLWDFHWAAGSSNYTIWATLYKDYTGRNFQGQAWCAMFGSDVMVLALQKSCGLSEQAAVQAARNLFEGELPYNCQAFVNQHMGSKRLNGKPDIGAHVIFWTGSKYGHWGIVTGVDSDGKGFTSVEGNTSGGVNKIDPDGGAVVEKWHQLDGKTKFWHPDYDEVDALPLLKYPIVCGGAGLKITTGCLNIRKSPEDGDVVGCYYRGERIYPSEKRFINGKPWYHTDKGWISARYVEGWVLEDNGRWWYVMPWYMFSVNAWQKIDNEYYYFDNTGYMVCGQWILWNGNYYYLKDDGAMAANCYVKSETANLYYWVNADGAWEPEWDTESPDLQKYRLEK